MAGACSAPLRSNHGMTQRRHAGCAAWGTRPCPLRWRTALAAWVAKGGNAKLCATPSAYSRVVGHVRASFTPTSLSLLHFAWPEQRHAPSNSVAAPRSWWYAVCFEIRWIASSRMDQNGLTLHSAPPLLDLPNAIMARAIALARQVARSDAAVLVAGESGSGRHMLARAIHGWSARCDRPFVIARPAHGERWPDGELFIYLDQIGKHRHRWVGTSDAGTLLFEEVGDLPAAQQAVLLRLLDERSWNKAPARSSTSMSG